MLGFSCIYFYIKPNFIMHIQEMEAMHIIFPFSNLQNEILSLISQTTISDYIIINTETAISSDSKLLIWFNIQYNNNTLESNT